MKAVTIDKYRPVFFDWHKLYAHDHCAVGEAFGGKVWSDGHIMMLGDAPSVADISELTSKQTAAVAARCTADTLKPITPLGVVDDEEYNVLVFDDGTTLQAKYYLLIMEAWPDALFFGSGWEQQITARVDGKPVAAVMPLKRDKRLDLKAEVLQSANAEGPQPPKTPEKSAKGKKEAN